MGHFLRQLVRLVILREMKKVTAGGWGGGEMGFGELRVYEGLVNGTAEEKQEIK